MKTSNRNQFSLQWIGVYTVTLAIYLGFFHSCLGATYQECISYGVGFWLAWLSVCWVARGAFLKRFEFWLYQMVGIDILLEGFNPFHDHYGFYWCALAFWSVLLVYRLIPATAVEKASVTESGESTGADTVMPELSN